MHALWKKSHEKPRLHIKKQRHRFANKCAHSQRYDFFFSSHVQMWELDNKEGWALKNWCFQIVVLEKTLENPLDSKKIKPVNPKGSTLNIHWKYWYWSWSSNSLSDVKSQLIGKDPDAEKDWGQEEKVWDGWMASSVKWTCIWANSRKQRRTGKPGILQFMGLQRVRHNLVSEQQHNTHKSMYNSQKYIFINFQKVDPSIMLVLKSRNRILPTALKFTSCSSLSPPFPPRIIIYPHHYQ